MSNEIDGGCPTTNPSYESTLPRDSRIRRAWYAFSVTGFAMATMTLITLLTLIFEYKTPIAENYNDNMTYVAGIVAVMYVGGSIVDNSGFLSGMGNWFGRGKTRSAVPTATTEVAVSTPVGRGVG